MKIKSADTILINGRFLTMENEDYLSVPDLALKDVSVYMTISGGEVVYKK